MMYHWQQMIEQRSPEHPGILIDAVQRHLQFDTFTGIIPHEAIELLFSDEYLERIAEQAESFYTTHRDVLNAWPQNAREEAVRAHLGGIIQVPAPDADLWRTSFKELHERNRRLYDTLSTTGRIEQLLASHPLSDLVATTVGRYLSETVGVYTPSELVRWVMRTMTFYHANEARLGHYGIKEQQAALNAYLSGLSDSRQ